MVESVIDETYCTELILFYESLDREVRIAHRIGLKFLPSREWTIVDYIIWKCYLCFRNVIMLALTEAFYEICFWELSVRYELLVLIVVIRIKYCLHHLDWGLYVLKIFQYSGIVILACFRPHFSSEMIVVNFIHTLARIDHIVELFNYFLIILNHATSQLYVISIWAEIPTCCVFTFLFIVTLNCLVIMESFICFRTIVDQLNEDTSNILVEVSF